MTARSLKADVHCFFCMFPRMRAVESIVFDHKHVLLSSQRMNPTRQFTKMDKQVTDFSDADITLKNEYEVCSNSMMSVCSNDV